MFPWTFCRDLYYRFPFSGDLAQRIEPETDWFFGRITPETGDGEIEKAVFSEVATYGKQLGVLTEVVLALVEKAPKGTVSDLKALDQLKTIKQRIEDVKAGKKDRIKVNAEKWLDKLAASDPEGLKTLLRRYQE